MSYAYVGIRYRQWARISSWSGYYLRQSQRSEYCQCAYIFMRQPSFQNNVLIDADKTARLADPGMTGRKIQYMAPELDGIKGRTTQEADLFALAYVLAEVRSPPSSSCCSC